MNEQRYNWVRVASATNMPVTVANCKEWCRILGADISDAFVEQCIRVAAEYIEDETQHIFAETSIRLTFNRFPYYVGASIAPYSLLQSAIELPCNPVVSITSFTYKDADGVVTPVTNYQLGNKAWPARLAPTPQTVWPFADPFRLDSVNIEYVAGYSGSTVGAMPLVAKMAIYYLVGHMIEQREPVVMAGSPGEVPRTLQTAINKLRVSNWA